MAKKRVVKLEGNQNAVKLVDWETVDRLLSVGCIGEEIAQFLGISYDTIQRHCVSEKGTSFADYVKNGNGNFKVSLRRLQARSASGYVENVRDDEGKIIDRRIVPPSVTMQIWLGKQFLGQRDQVESTVHLPELKVQPINKDEQDKINDSLEKLNESYPDIQPES